MDRICIDTAAARYESSELVEDFKYEDPVCKHRIKLNKGYGMIHKGKLYLFCSRNCLERFESDADFYLITNQKVTKA